MGAEGLSDRSKRLVSNSLTKQTAQQYSRYIDKFRDHCRLHTISFTEATIASGIEFLSHLFYDEALNYSGINQAKSALSLVIKTPTHKTFGDTDIVKRFMAGVFKLKPTFPRYTTTFDASIVLQHIRLINNDVWLH